MRNAQELLYLFVRYPEPGRVLTTLQPHLGGVGAAQLAQSVAEHVALDTDRLVHPGLERIVLVDPPERLGDVADWLGYSFNCRARPGRTETDALEAAFATAFDAGAKRVVAMQTNCLDLKAELVRNAFSSLHRVDAVLGPAQSGGCALIGLRTHKPGLLAGVDWSTHHAFERIKRKILGSGSRCNYLPRVRDLNRVEDLTALAPSWPDILDDFAERTS